MEEANMRAVVADEPGGPEVLSLRQIPVPEPGPGEVRLRVAYCSMNPMDVFARRGVLSWLDLDWPFTPGIEHAGVVEKVGPGVDDALLGRRMQSRANWGGNAEYSIAPVTQTGPVPDGLDWKTGSVFGGMTYTAWHCLHTTARIRQGDVCVFHSAAGPVGVMLIQVAKDAGATVIGLAGGPEKLAYAASFGADHGIDYRDSGWPAEVMRLTDGHGADIIVDGNQGPDAPRNFDAMAPNGRLIYIGATAGAPAPDVPVGQLIGKSILVGGFNLPVLTATGVAERDHEQIIENVRSGRWKIPISGEVALEDVPELHARFERRELMGRTVIRVGGDL